jgi:hypothetical protein
MWLIWPKITEFHTFGLLSHLVKIKYKVENVNTSRSACKGPALAKLLNKEKITRSEKENNMNRLLRFTPMALTLAAFLFAAAPANAQSVDDRIKALEQELIQLKEQQIEMKREATEAAAALPSFEYRPGAGLKIEAADKSWSWRTSFEAHMRYVFESGRDQVGRSQGELMGRRFRPEFYLCVNNCLWEIDWRLDLDGFGTNTALQRGVIYFHAENLNPWLPAVQFGMDTTNSGPNSLSRQGSGATGAQAEYDLHTRNNAFNTGSASSGMTFTWDDKDLSSVGIPGRIARFQTGMNAYGEGGDGTQINTDRKDFHVYGNIQPFSQIKNKWISGLLFEYGAWFCNVDNRALANGCSRYRVQDHGDGGRQTLFDSGANSIGDGLHVAQGPGLVWSVGPYSLRAMMHFQRSEDRGTGSGGTAVLGRGQKKANSFLIGHDIYLWSPKGWFTGSSTTTGSVLFGTHFERVDMSVGCNGNTGITCPATLNSGDFHRNTILLREWDLWYYVAPRMSVGVNFLWYDAANLTNARNQAAHNLGVCSSSRIAAGNCRNGIGGDWVDAFFNWRYVF